MKHTHTHTHAHTHTHMHTHMHTHIHTHTYTQTHTHTYKVQIPTVNPTSLMTLLLSLKASASLLLCCRVRLSLFILMLVTWVSSITFGDGVFCGVSAVSFSSRNASLVLVSAVFIRPLKRQAKFLPLVLYFSQTRRTARLKDPSLG